MPETLSRAADLIAATGAVETVTWQQLQVQGRFVIDKITAAIADCDLASFDITRLNQNVMFEVGFAIGAGRRLWLLLQPSHKDAQRTWEEIRILSTVDYRTYEGSEDIRAAFLRDMPHLSAAPLLDTIDLEPASTSSLFYIPALHRTDADRSLTRRIYKEEARGFRIVNADPGEASVYPFAWYAQQIYAADAVVIHLSSEERRGSEIHNARCALLAGFAHGIGRPLLMLAEANYYSPIDYRDLLYVYPTARDCLARAELWLSQQGSLETVKQRRLSRAAQLRLQTELKSLRLGEDVAENEADQLSEYFIETDSYRHVLERATTLFVGRKGTGKTANLIQASEELAGDKRNLVVVIKPQSYELEAVMAFLSGYVRRDAQSFVVNAFWEYLLQTEIAIAAGEELRHRPLATLSGQEREFLSFIDSYPDLFEEFAVRLESTSRRLAEVKPGDSIREIRDRVGEALYSSEIQVLRRYLGELLEERERVAVLIDNLDKAWGRTAIDSGLPHLILGLLSAIGEVARDFRKSDHWRKPVKLTLAVFLRSDIFYRVLRVAREPDKIPHSRLRWTDPQLLLRVIEERYVASKGGEADPSHLWTKYFPPTVRDIPTRDYLTGTVLPRPRDVLHFCNAAISSAINAGHERVTEEDMLSAETEYSQFALEALRVENGIPAAELEEVLYQFFGANIRMSAEETRGLIASAGIEAERVEEIIQHLRALTFLGTEVEDSRFMYAEDPEDVRRADALGVALEKRRGVPPGLEIHPAFRAYLEAR